MRRSSCGEDVEPLVAVVGHEFWLAGSQHLLEDLHAARVLGQGHEDAAVAFAQGLEVYPGVTAGRGGDQLVECDVVLACEGMSRSRVGRRLPDSRRDRVLTDSPVVAARASRVSPRSRRSVRSRGPMASMICSSSAFTESTGSSLQPSQIWWAAVVVRAEPGGAGAQALPDVRGRP